MDENETVQQGKKDDVDVMWDELKKENFPGADSPKETTSSETIDIDSQHGSDDHTSKGAKKDQPDTKEEVDGVQPQDTKQQIVMSPELEKAFKGLSDRIDALQGIPERFRKIEGTVGNIKDEVKRTKEALKGQPTAEEFQKALDLEKKLDELRKEDPELWEGIDNKLGPLTQELDQLKKTITGIAEKSVGNNSDDLDSMVQKKAQSLYEERIENERVSELNILKEHKPDHQQYYGNEIFEGWFKDQPHDIKLLRKSFRAVDYLRMFRKFDESDAGKKYRGEVQQHQADNVDDDLILKQNKDRLDSAALPDTSKRKTKPHSLAEKHDDELSDEEYWKRNQERIWK